MILAGKVIETVSGGRILRVLERKRIFFLYLRRRDFREFGPCLRKKTYIFVKTDGKKKKIGNVSAYETEEFIRIVRPACHFPLKKRIVCYDLKKNKRDIIKLITPPHNKMFVDLEFTMPSHYQTMVHVPEIVQYGIVIENEEGKIVFEDASLIKPSKPYNLNARTLKFLSRKRKDFEQAGNYDDFYDILLKVLSDYDPKIYTWGPSDIRAIEQSFEINGKPDPDIRFRNVNLMNIIRNYYGLRDEIGLFRAYEEMSGMKLTPQRHDALEDAEITRGIYGLFKADLLTDGDMKKGVGFNAESGLGALRKKGKIFPKRFFQKERDREKENAKITDEKEDKREKLKNRF